MEPMEFWSLEKTIPEGALTEISGAPGAGKTELLLQFLALHPALRVAWIEERLTVYPNALEHFGVSLDRVLFMEAGADSLWAAQQALRSGVFQVVVLSSSLAEMDLRRMQLAAERARARVVLLPEAPTRKGAWPIALQLEVCRPTVRVLRHRKGGSIWSASSVF